MRARACVAEGSPGCVCASVPRPPCPPGKLVIVGSRRTLRASPVLAEVIALVEQQGWVQALPPDAGLEPPFW